MSLVKQGTSTDEEIQTFFYSDLINGYPHNALELPLIFVEFFNNPGPFGRCVDWKNMNPIFEPNEYKEYYIEPIEQCVDFAVDLLEKGFNVKTGKSKQCMDNFLDSVPHHALRYWRDIFTPV